MANASVPTPSRGFAATLRQITYSLGMRAMLLAHRATVAARRAATRTGETLAQVVKMPTTTSRTTVGAVALSLVLLVVAAVIIAALTR